MRSWLMRLVFIAEQPGDDDAVALRKRIGVVAGYVTIVAPVAAPLVSGGHPIALVAAPCLSLLSTANLVVLARTRRFERYVVVLLIAGAAFTLLMNIATGGLASGAGPIWAFLGPVYAILALGPRKAIPWFGVFLAVLLIAVVIDPWVTSTIAPPPYGVRLISFAQNIGLPLGITFALLHYTDVRRRNAEARSEQLLTNAIPVAIAARLKRGEGRIADSYPETSVLFADIAGFTPWANGADPATIVGLLDDLFTRFDALAVECGIEKIKTIGDAYMAVAGAPLPRPDHAEVALRMSAGMLTAVEGWRRDHGLALQIRIGVASGPVVAGIIGERRILFDLWGDTVNTASRMESAGVPGRIQVAPSTYELTRNRHEFEQREVDIKGLGPMTTYLLVEE